ncbi:MAG TPA: hypothetical protein ENI41_07320 [Deltaproteobacteria bacterium]|nr:MAG: hypothetical protein DRG83_07955 [Deltaproteobacteria bacterium]HEC32284.1 hypothetical protein [Deltaproteobacteria bacterium]
MTRTRPYYSKKQIVNLLRKGRVYVTDEALYSAEDAFGWNLEDIKNALMRLMPKHWYKSEPRFDNPKIWVDYYRARNIMGENIYTHFYVEEDILIIDSFKEL